MFLYEVFFIYLVRILSFFFFLKEGEELKSVFLISDGSVKEYNSYYDKSHYFGDILGMP